MSVLQHVRGDTETNDAYTGEQAEITVDTDRWELRLHDKFNPGGHRILNLQQLMEIFMLLTSEFGDVEFPPSDRGYLVRTGNRIYDLREIKGSHAIDVVDGLATEADTVIKRDFTYPSMKAKHNGTTGPDDAFVANCPAEWDDGDGCFMFIRFHLAPNPEPAAGHITLQMQPSAPEGEVDLPDPFPPRILRLADNRIDIHTAVGADFDCLVLAAGASYKLIGMTGNTIGGSTGDGPGATPGGDPAASMYSFPGYSFESSQSEDISLAPGEYKYILAICTSNASNDTHLIINGQDILPAIQDDEGFEFRAIVYNNGGTLMYDALVTRHNNDMIPSPIGPTADQLFQIGSLSSLGAISGTFNITIDSPAMLPKIGQSAAGVQGG